MKKGGYQIIDLENRNIAVGASSTYEGIYDKIEGTRKPIYVSGIQIGGVEYHDTYIDFTVSGTNFVGKAYGHIFTISDLDVITITAE